MIFLTVGTERFQFDRLIKSLDDAVIAGKITDDVFAQTGSSGYSPKSFAWKQFLSFNEMANNIRKADVVVSHAGVGSVMLSLSLNKVPIIFPRLHKMGEHLDDHQLEFSRKLETTKRAIIAYDTDQLIEKIRNYRDYLQDMKSAAGESGKSLQAYLRNQLF